MPLADAGEARQQRAESAIRAKLEAVRGTNIGADSFLRRSESAAFGNAPPAAAGADFLSRLAQAEQRDGESITRKHTVTADALDALLIDGAHEDDGLFIGGGATAASTATSVWPTAKEIKKMVQLFWTSPAERRVARPDSSMAVAGSFAVPEEAVLDEAAFCKLMALVQNSKGCRKSHSTAQQAGWHAAFRAMDFDATGALTKEKIQRFLDRRKRALLESQKEHEAHARRQVQAGSELAVELQTQVESHIHQKHARESALAALQAATGRAAVRGVMALFPLTLELAPPYFDCERATLWIVRAADDEDSFTSVAGASFNVGGGGGSSFASSGGGRGGSSFKRGGGRASFKQQGYKLGPSVVDLSSSSQSFSRGSSFTSTSFTNDLGAGGARRTLDESFSSAPVARLREIFSIFGGKADGSCLAEDGRGAGDADGGGADQAAQPGGQVSLKVNALSIAGTAVDVCEPQLVGNAYADSRFDTSFDERTGYVTRSILCIPLMRPPPAGGDADDGAAESLDAKRARCVGCLQLVNKLPADAKPPSEFSSRDLRAGRDFCAALAAAICAALPREAQREAREAERRRVLEARDEANATRKGQRDEEKERRRKRRSRERGRE